MELLLSLGITWTIMHFWEAGKREYGHVRDRHAAEIAREHPAWSPRKIQRRAKRRARGYWWDQIRRGFPDLKAAYEEDRLIAERERVLGSLDGEMRRKDLRDQIRAAIEEHGRLKEEERKAEDARRKTRPDANSRPEPPTAPKAEEPKPGPQPDQPQPIETFQCVRCQQQYTKAAFGRTGPDGPLCAGCGPLAEPAPTPKPAPTPEPAPSPEPAHEPEPERVPQVRFLRPVPPAPTTQGETMIADTAGYEQILTGMSEDVDSRTSELDGLSARLQELQDRDSAYEARMAALRGHNADDQTIETISHLREANEAQIKTAEEQVAAAEHSLNAAAAVRDDWVARHGAVMETKAGTGAAGDEALYRV